MLGAAGGGWKEDPRMVKESLRLDEGTRFPRVVGLDCWGKWIFGRGKGWGKLKGEHALKCLVYSLMTRFDTHYGRFLLLVGKFGFGTLNLLRLVIMIKYVGKDTGYWYWTGMVRVKDAGKFPGDQSDTRLDGNPGVPLLTWGMCVGGRRAAAWSFLVEQSQAAPGLQRSRWVSARFAWSRVQGDSRKKERNWIGFG